MLSAPFFSFFFKNTMTQDATQAIFIKQTETRNDASKPYTVYRIDVQAPVRQWHIWKRYSDFIELHQKLVDRFPDISIPAHLPQKRFFPPTFHAPDRVEERRQGLENYLRAIQSHRDDRWRNTDIWNAFLALPIEGAAKKKLFSFTSWLDEYDDLLVLSREIRALINSRNAHQGQQEVTDAMRSEVNAKKNLTTLSARLANLETSLKNQEKEGVVVEGEERRREDKLNILKSEKDMLVQLLSATNKQELTGRQVKKIQSAASAAALSPKHGDIGFDHPVHRAKTTTASPRQGRAFGNALRQQIQETEQTKGLDNQELLQYQNQVMRDQDIHVEQFSHLLNRQKEIGLAINYELESHIDVLEDLDSKVDHTSQKLAFANKKLSKIK